MWKTEFLNFETRYWDHSFTIKHQYGHKENFSFIHKETLFIGLNMVGGNFEQFWIKLLLGKEKRALEEASSVAFLARGMQVADSHDSPAQLLFHAFPRIFQMN